MTHRSTNPVQQHTFKRASLIIACAFLTACSIYKPDIAQGNIVSASQMAELKVGMTRQQVSQTLGTAMLQDVFNTNRWDYVYRNLKGNGALAQRVLTVYFDGTGKLDRWTGEGAPEQKDIADLPKAPLNDPLQDQTKTQAQLALAPVPAEQVSLAAAQATANLINTQALGVRLDPNILAVNPITSINPINPNGPSSSSSAPAAGAPAPVTPPTPVAPTAPAAQARPIVNLALSPATSAQSQANNAVQAAPIAAAPVAPIPQVPSPITTQITPPLPSSVIDAAAPSARTDAVLSFPASMPSLEAKQAIEQTIAAWRSAWVSKDISRYASYYTERYSGELTSSSAWLAQRKRVFDDAGDINIGLSNFNIIQTSDTEARASFTQRYQSARLSETGTKNLFFKRIDGNWRIVAERFVK